jgi:hypothetical protein
MDSARKHQLFPREAVVLEETFTEHQPKMRMNMNQPVSRLIIREKACDGWMFSIGNRRKPLESVIQQNGLGRALILAGNEQVQIAIAC